MKKKIIGILVCMLLISLSVLSVSGNLEIKNIKEKHTTTNAKAFHKDSFKEQNLIETSMDREYRDFIVTTQQTSDGGYIGMGYTDSYGEGEYDAWMIKTNSNGIENWNKTFGGSDVDAFVGGQQTSDGGYILTGRYDFFYIPLIKTDANGDEEWSKTFGLDLFVDVGYFVQQTSDGGYIITGITKSYSTRSDLYDVWLIKTDSDGEEEWNKTFGGEYSDGGFVVREIDGGYIITGWSASFGNLNNYDVWLIKTDSNGNELWNETYGGSGGDVGHDVQQTGDGYIIIGTTSSYGDNDNDFWLIKTDELGNEEWNKTYDGADAASQSEQFGCSAGMCILEISGGYIMTGITDASYGHGSLDILVIETDDEGNEQWNQTYGGSDIDEGYWMNETSDGGYVLCGTTSSYGSASYDGWLIKIDSNGEEDWNRTYGDGPTVHNPPNDPSIPEGPEFGIIDMEYMFNTSTEDPDDDDIYYWFDWGDGTNSGWIGPYGSGETGSASNIWTLQGDYEIKAKAKDEFGFSSGWSLPLTIHIAGTNNPPYKPIISGLTEIKVGEEYEYIFCSEDPENDNVYYHIDWGDDTNTSWLGPYDSDTELSLTHTWDKKGDFEIRCKAKDIYGDESEEATLRITVPKNKILNLHLNVLSCVLKLFPNSFPIIRYLLG